MGTLRHPMQRAWSYYNGQRYFFGRDHAQPFDRAAFAKCLREAHEMIRFEQLRDAGAFMPKTRVEAIDAEISRLTYAPWGVNVDAKRRELEAEKAELLARAELARAA